MMEKRLLAIAATMPSVTILRGWVGQSLEQDAEGVTLGILRNPDEDASGETRSIRARFWRCETLHNGFRDGRHVLQPTMRFFAVPHRFVVQHSVKLAD